MKTVLAFNPGSNSLKFDIVKLARKQPWASDGKKLLSGSVEDIGKESKLVLFHGREIEREEPIEAGDFSVATKGVLRQLDDGKFDGAPALSEIDLAGVRVVHGAEHFQGAVHFDPKVRATIEQLEILAPLHNKNSLLIIDAVHEHSPKVPIAVAFDTAFHHTMPEHAWRYPIPRDLADRHGIRRYGFHGLSHRYMLDRFAQISDKPASGCTVVALHLESGCSATAIANGKSVDNTMGLTPLEGLMMGTRSGSIDPAVIPLLVQEEKLSPEEVLEILNKKSGLFGVSDVSLDTRVLMKQIDTNPAVRLAMEMFCYRVRLAVGAYLAALDGCQAVLFGGGIGENTPFVRTRVCEGLRFCGLHLDKEANEQAISGEHRISTEPSKLHAWTIPVEEGLQIAHECALALAD